jgi:DNA primase
MLEKPLVVVEDLLSSYKLRLAGYPTLCLLGTKLDSQALNVVQMFRTKRVVLWLDDDTAGHTAAKKLFVELSPVVPNVTAMFTQQPKEVDMSVLRDMEL